MAQVTVIIMLACASILTLLGTFVLASTMLLPKRPPMDKTNRINHLRLVWFALKAPEDFVKLTVYDAATGTYKQAFPWLLRDERDNIEGPI